MSVNRDDIFKMLIACLLSTLIYIGNNVLNSQADMSCRLRIVELNQARIMARMDIDPVSNSIDPLRVMSKNKPP